MFTVLKLLVFSKDLKSAAIFQDGGLSTGGICGTFDIFISEANLTTVQSFNIVRIC